MTSDLWKQTLGCSLLVVAIHESPSPRRGARGVTARRNGETRADLVFLQSLRSLSRSGSPAQRCVPENEGSPPCASGTPCALASSARATPAGNPRSATTAAKMNHAVLLPTRSPDVKQKRQCVSLTDLAAGNMRRQAWLSRSASAYCTHLRFMRHQIYAGRVR